MTHWRMTAQRLGGILSQKREDIVTKKHVKLVVLAGGLLFLAALASHNLPWLWQVQAHHSKCLPVIPAGPSDGFDGSALNCQWRIVTPRLNGEARVRIDDGSLVTTASGWKGGEAFNPTWHASLTSRVLLSGDFDAQVSFDGRGNDRTWYAHLMASPPFARHERPPEAFRSLMRFKDGDLVYAGEIRHQGKPHILDGKGVEHAADEPWGRLRIARRDDTAYTYYWQDGAWVLLESGPIGADDMVITLYTSAQSRHEVTVLYDDLIVETAAGPAREGTSRCLGES